MTKPINDSIHSRFRYDPYSQTQIDYCELGSQDYVTKHLTIGVNWIYNRLINSSQKGPIEAGSIGIDRFEEMARHHFPNLLRKLKHYMHFTKFLEECMNCFRAVKAVKNSCIIFV